MVHFVGAGSGAPDLITLRGARLLGEADVVIYAGSLVNPELLTLTKPGCEVHDSAKLTLEEVIALIERAEREGKITVRLHTGDPSIYGAVREQFDELDKLGIAYDVCPGVSAFCGAAASLKTEYTLPDVSQTVIITRAPGRTPVPEKQSIAALAAHAAAAGVDAEHIREILDCAACDDAVRILRECGRDAPTLARVTERALFHLSHRADGMEAGLLMFSKEYGVLGQSENAPALLKKIMEE